MKVLVKNVELYATPIGGVIELVGEKHRLRLMGASPDAFFGLTLAMGIEQCHCHGENAEDKCADCSGETDDRMNLTQAIQSLANGTKVEYVYINGVDQKNYVAEIRINGETKKIVPSVGVFIAKALNAPIYFNSELAQNDQSQMIA